MAMKQESQVPKKEEPSEREGRLLEELV